MALKEIEHPCLLLVEGKRDQHFFFEIAKFTDREILDIIWFEQAGGKSKELLEDALDTLRITPGFKRVQAIGVAHDADDNPIGAFQSVQHTLQKLGFDTPANTMELSVGTPQTVVMILPDPNLGNSRHGALEHLCLDAFADDPVLGCVDVYFNCLNEKAAPLPGRVFEKAKFQALLAAKEPDISPEDAFSKDWFPKDSQTFDQVKQFLNLLTNAVS